jgi:phosphatidylglycerophosphate synthase
MFDDVLRGLKARLYVPLLLIVDTLPVIFQQPVFWTITGLIFGCASALSRFRSDSITSVPAALWLVNRFCDGADGEVARRYSKQSTIGGLVDLFADYVVYCLVPLSTCRTAQDWMVACFLLTTMLLNTVVWMFMANILSRGKDDPRMKTTILMPAGIIEGGETVIVYTILLAVPPDFGSVSACHIIGIFALSIGFTVLHRLHWACKLFSNSGVHNYYDSGNSSAKGGPTS